MEANVSSYLSNFDFFLKFKIWKVLTGIRYTGKGTYHRLSSLGNALWDEDWGPEISLGSAVERVKEAGLGRGRSWAVMQSTKGLSHSHRALWRLDAASRTNQSGWMQKGKVALMSQGEALEKDSLENCQPPTLSAAGGVTLQSWVWRPPLCTMISMAVHSGLGAAIPKLFWVPFPGATRNFIVLEAALGAIVEADHILPLLPILDSPHPLLV